MAPVLVAIIGAVVGAIVNFGISTLAGSLSKNSSLPSQGPTLEDLLRIFSNDFAHKVENIIRTAFANQEIRGIKQKIENAIIEFRTYTHTLDVNTPERVHLDNASRNIVSAYSILKIRCNEILTRPMPPSTNDPALPELKEAFQTTESAIYAFHAIAAVDLLILAKQAEINNGILKEIIVRTNEYLNYIEDLLKLLANYQKRIIDESWRIHKILNKTLYIFSDCTWIKDDKSGNFKCDYITREINEILNLIIVVKDIARKHYILYLMEDFPISNANRQHEIENCISNTKKEAAQFEIYTIKPEYLTATTWALYKIFMSEKITDNKIRYTITHSDAQRKKIDSLLDDLYPVLKLTIEQNDEPLLRYYLNLLKMSDLRLPRENGITYQSRYSDAQNESLLNIAMRGRQFNIIQLLLLQTGIDQATVLHQARKIALTLNNPEIITLFDTELTRKFFQRLRDYKPVTYGKEHPSLSYLNHGVNINHREANIGTVLHRAVDTNNIFIMEALLTIGIDTTITDDNGRTAFALAMHNNNNRAIRILASHEMFQAVEVGNLAEITRWRELGADVNYSVQYSTYSAKSIVASIYRSRCKKAVFEYFIQLDDPVFFNPEYISDRELKQIYYNYYSSIQAKERFLRHAIQGNMAISSYLLCSDANYQDPLTGNTALHLAILNGHKNITTLLLSHPGINTLTTNSQGNNPVQIAIQQNREEILNLITSHFLQEGNTVQIRQLLVSGINVNYQDETGKTALFKALKANNRLEIILLLLEFNANLDVRDRLNQSVKDCALKERLYDIVNLIDERSHQPVSEKNIYLASAQSNCPLLSRILDNGININSQHEITGDSALHAAARVNCESAIRLLIQRGINISLTNTQDQTALELENKLSGGIIFEELLKTGRVSAQEACKWIEKNWIDINYRNAQTGESFLHTFVNVLYRKNINRNNSFFSRTHADLSQNETYIMQTLINADLYIGNVNNEGINAVTLARNLQMENIALKILEQAASKQLQKLVRQNKFPRVKELLELGINVNGLNHCYTGNDTPLSIAIKSSNSIPMVKLLCQYGAQLDPGYIRKTQSPAINDILQAEINKRCRNTLTYSLFLALLVYLYKQSSSENPLTTIFLLSSMAIFATVVYNKKPSNIVEEVVPEQRRNITLTR